MASNFFFGIFNFINWCQNEFQDNNGKFAADPEIGFLTKTILKPYGRAAAMPTALELKLKITGTGETGAIGTPTFRSWNVDCSVLIGGS